MRDAIQLAKCAMWAATHHPDFTFVRFKPLNLLPCEFQFWKNQDAKGRIYSWTLRIDSSRPSLAACFYIPYHLIRTWNCIDKDCLEWKDEYDDIPF